MPEPTIVRCPACGKANRVRPEASGVPVCGNCGKPLPWLVGAGDANFDEVTRAGKLPVLVDFWAPWCGPCRMVSPLVARLGAEDAGRLKGGKLNTDEAPEISLRYGVQGIPLLVLIKDGSEVDRLVGAVPLERLRAWLEPHLEPTRETA